MDCITTLSPYEANSRPTAAHASSTVQVLGSIRSICADLWHSLIFRRVAVPQITQSPGCAEGKFRLVDRDEPIDDENIGRSSSSAAIVPTRNRDTLTPESSASISPSLSSESPDSTVTSQTQSTHSITTVITSTPTPTSATDISTPVTSDPYRPSPTLPHRHTKPTRADEPNNKGTSPSPLTLIGDSSLGFELDLALVVSPTLAGASTPTITPMPTHTPTHTPTPTPSPTETPSVNAKKVLAVIPSQDSSTSKKSGSSTRRASTSTFASMTSTSTFVSTSTLPQVSTSATIATQNLSTRPNLLAPILGSVLGVLAILLLSILSLLFLRRKRQRATRKKMMIQHPAEYPDLTIPPTPNENIDRDSAPTSTPLRQLRAERQGSWTWLERASVASSAFSPWLRRSQVDVDLESNGDRSSRAARSIRSPATSPTNPNFNLTFHPGSLKLNRNNTSGSDSFKKTSYYQDDEGGDNRLSRPVLAEVVFSGLGGLEMSDMGGEKGGNMRAQEGAGRFGGGKNLLVGSGGKRLSGLGYVGPPSPYTPPSASSDQLLLGGSPHIEVAQAY